MKTKLNQHFLLSGLTLLMVLQLNICFAGCNSFTTSAHNPHDTTLKVAIEKQLNGGKITGQLYYPKSVLRFYAKNNFAAAWIKPQSGTGPTWQAMLMIDCVLQFGLSHADYHPQYLQYNRLHSILDTPGRVNTELQAKFDIMLTDAIITLMNNLHYGKLNPEFPASRIDALTDNKFQAGQKLREAFEQGDLMAAIANVQPKSISYRNMQRRMHLLEGQLQEDCYEIPQAEVRKIAINMERLRWANTDDSVYLQINIPSYTLTLNLKGASHQFKVIVGKPETPTPTLNSSLTHFTTAPELKVPAIIFTKELLPKAIANTAYLNNNHIAIYDKNGRYIKPGTKSLQDIKKNPGRYFARQSTGCDNSLGLLAFRFPNIYDVYLHDTPEKELFKRKERTLSHGCIRVEQAEKLAGLLLQSDGSAAKIKMLHNGIVNHVKQDIFLRTPMPVKITYLTCEIKEGEMVSYKDIYNLDKSLEMALYSVDQTLTMR